MTFALTFTFIMLAGFLCMIVVEGNPSTKTLKQWLGFLAIAHIAATIGRAFPMEEAPEGSTVLLLAISVIYTLAAFNITEKAQKPQHQDH